MAAALHPTPQPAVSHLQPGTSFIFYLYLYLSLVLSTSAPPDQPPCWVQKDALSCPIKGAESMPEDVLDKQKRKKVNEKLNRMCKGIYDDLGSLKLADLREEWRSCQARCHLSSTSDAQMQMHVNVGSLCRRWLDRNKACSRCWFRPLGS